MNWTFETSLMTFLVVVALSQIISIKSKHRISIQFALGLIFVAGYAVGFFPKDMIEMSKMKDVGFIAFNVLIIHSGTMLDIDSLKQSKNVVALSVCASVFMLLMVGVGLQPIIGKEAAILSAAPVIGGGATSAIASVSVMTLYPYLTALPWILFMIQGFFCIPALRHALKEETELILVKSRSETSSLAMSTENQSDIGSDGSRSKGLCKPAQPQRIDQKYKHTAYYLGTLMVVSVLNQMMMTLVPESIKIHPALTALLLGGLLGHIGILDRSPLSSSDSFGFLMLGLMSLMCHTLAFTPLHAFLQLLIPAILVFLVGTMSLWIAGKWMAPYFGFSKSKGRIVAMSSMAGLPLAPILVEETAARYAGNEAEKAKIRRELTPAVVTSGLWVTNAFSILLVSVIMVFMK